MLVELSVRDLGVIAQMSVVLGPGMTAITGETGAGKTLVVEAIDLLMGGRADPSLVRTGAEEAVVEGRFELDGDEVIVSRIVPVVGRSRAFVNGRMATASTLSELGSLLVDLHGQHAHQSLLATVTQRQALDRFGGVDPSSLDASRSCVRSLESELEGLGGDERARARELDLLRFQVDEVTSAKIVDLDEEEALETEEEALAHAAAHRDTGEAALATLSREGGAMDSAGSAVAALSSRGPFVELEERLRGLVAELADAAADLRRLTESLEDDPARLEVVRARRQLLLELRRKYGETLAEVVTFGETAAERLLQLQSIDSRAEAVRRELESGRSGLADEEDLVRRARKEAAPRMSAAISTHLRELAMPHACVEVTVGDDGAGEKVEIMLAANPGSPLLPLAKVASGGELARSMLAVRLVTTSGPPTLVFDEVDAGVGGEAALAVGRALGKVAVDNQVLVVTHLAQVAAFADRQIAVKKHLVHGAARAEAEPLGSDERRVELGRMLSGQPDSRAARDHAQELLEVASEMRRTRSRA
jgi:DNA repair protein RecN (Recombination protein N)